MFTCDVCRKRIKRGAPFADMDFSYKQIMMKQSFNEHLILCEPCYCQIMEFIDDISEDAEDEFY